MFAASTWSFDAEVRYHGLMNLGKTCYLNSVLQVLFMTEDFREAVNSPSNTEFIDNHLRDLFDHLVNENSDPLEIITALGIDTVYEQRDAAEYFQKILRLTSPEAAKIFHGELTNRRICFSCGTTTVTDEPFWLLPLSLVDSPRQLYSVEDSISEFFNTSCFSGENQIYCKHCDTKVDACTNYVVKHHPEVLILMLKRFDFSYKYMTYIKINDAVDVPTFVEIPENQTYELYAVVDHFGDLRGGHYCSRIRSQVDSRWYEFNDTWVTLIDYNMERDIKRSNTAFLLFYRKKDTRMEQVMKASSHKDDCPVNSDNYYQNLMADDEAKTQRAEDGSEDENMKSTLKEKSSSCEDLLSSFSVPHWDGGLSGSDAFATWDEIGACLQTNSSLLQTYKAELHLAASTDDVLAAGPVVLDFQTAGGTGPDGRARPHTLHLDEGGGFAGPEQL